MAFSRTPNVHIGKDSDGNVHLLRHLQRRYDSGAGDPPPPRKLAARYLHDVARIYGFDEAVLSTLSESPPDEIQPGEESRLRFEVEKEIGNTRVVSFVQSYLGLPVWESGFRVIMVSDPLQVICSTSTYDKDVQPINYDENGQYLPQHEAKIRLLLKNLAERADAELISLNEMRSLIYRYQPKTRLSDDTVSDGGDETAPFPTLPLDDVPDDIQPGRHNLVTEVLFTLSFPPWHRLHWRAFIEHRTGAILYLRPGVIGVDGMVFPYDPQSLSRDPTVNACSSEGILSPLRQRVTLRGLETPTGSPALYKLEADNDYVTLGEIAAPSAVSPTAARGTDFAYLARSEQFAAVNGYYHCDRAFRLIESLGFDLSTYFGGTCFPIIVDHRDESHGEVNAYTYANCTFTGLKGFGFNRCWPGCLVGNAADFRVVWHEIGHSLTLNQMRRLHIGFSHSAGDALAALLSDWEVPSLDRGETFPFTDFDRRHDRKVGDGWGWGGAHDLMSLGSEQILSSTLFRFYQSIGGDSPDLATRQLAAHHAAHLLIGAIGLYSPFVIPGGPDDFATSLMAHDTACDFRGISRGALHKVVRWAFKEQGLYQGAPPPVDVYIDDGRGGDYQYRPNFWNCQDIWNRLAADQGTTHQSPVVGTPNYLYVRVQNRGSQAAANVTVKAFRCRPSTGLVWPVDWTPLATPEVTHPNNLAAGGTVVMGPFDWTPTVEGHECLLAIVSAVDDLANDTTVTSSIRVSRFVPFDNNIAQRNVAPVPAAGHRVLVKNFYRQRFWCNNPFQREVKASLQVLLPDFLEDRGWRLNFLNPGAAEFALGPQDDREIIMELQRGSDFSANDLPQRPAARMIEVRALIDGELVGGMTYLLDPTLTASGARRRGPLHRIVDWLSRLIS